MQIFLDFLSVRIALRILTWMTKTAARRFGKRGSFLMIASVCLWEIEAFHVLTPRRSSWKTRVVLFPWDSFLASSQISQNDSIITGTMASHSFLVNRRSDSFKRSI